MRGESPPLCDRIAAAIKAKAALPPARRPSHYGTLLATARAMIDAYGKDERSQQFADSCDVWTSMCLQTLPPLLKAASGELCGPLPRQMGMFSVQDVSSYAAGGGGGAPAGGGGGSDALTSLFSAAMGSPFGGGEGFDDDDDDDDDDDGEIAALLGRRAAWTRSSRRRRWHSEPSSGSALWRRLLRCTR